MLLNCIAKKLSNLNMNFEVNNYLDYENGKPINVKNITIYSNDFDSLFNDLKKVNIFLNGMENDLLEVYDQTGTYLSVSYDLGFFTIVISEKA